MTKTQAQKRLQKVADLLKQAGEKAGEIFDEMDAYYYDRSDAWKEGSAGEAHEDAMTVVENVHDAIDDVLRELEDELEVEPN